MKKITLSIITFLLAIASYADNVNVTDKIKNPNFDSSADGWTVNMPGAQNKGYQTSKYSSSEATIDHFVEAWTPNGNTLGSGYITQSISGLSEGKYTLEADMVARGGDDPHGAFLVAESTYKYSQEIQTKDTWPRHITLPFYHTGDRSITIGARTEATCTVNWLAFDNVRLYYNGPLNCKTTSVKLSETEVTTTIGESFTLNASVTTNDEVFNKVTWASATPSIAKVDKYGCVTAVAAGTAKIIATAVNSDLTAICTVNVKKSDYTNLHINEIQVANIDRFIDPSYNYGGWIELYNSGEKAIALKLCYVSDDPSNLKKFQLPSSVGSVPPGGFMNIWFEHNATEGNYGGLSKNNVNFKLNAEGGTIYLSDSDGEIITQETYPPSIARCSYARIEDGSAEWAMTGDPTPEATNAGSKFSNERLAAPVVSRDGGILSGNENIQFSVQIPSGATLRYTTDGSTPTMENGKTSSSGKFVISGVSLIYRFALYKDGYLPSPVVTRSFIYMNRDYCLPILSVVTDPDNLYDDTIGIYTKGTNGTSGNGRSDACNWNRDWERPVNIEYMVPDKNTESQFITYLNQETDMEIAGGWTRAYYGTMIDKRYWPMRGSFRLKCDKRYEGVNSLNYQLFPNKPYNKYKVWQVRNGGNDGNRTMDAALNQIVLQSGFYVDAQDASPAHIFLNGEYLGMFNIRESNNRHYGDSNYGIDTDEMDQFDLSNAKYNQKVGDSQAWDELQELASQLKVGKDKETWEKICSRMDMDEYINYMALECWIGSSDWLTNVNNFKGFRSRDDGKFHFVLFDADQAFSYRDMLSMLLNNDYGANVDDLFRNLWQYDGFRKQFVDAYCIVNGSVMNPDFAVGVATDFYNKINYAMTLEGGGASLNIVNQIKSYYNGTVMKTLESCTGTGNPYFIDLSSNINSAKLSLNDQMIPTGKFRGNMYDYNGNGIHLTAKAPAGYIFKGWKQLGTVPDGSGVRESLINNGSNWDYYDEGSLDGTQWKTTGVSYWKNSKAPFGFASNTEKYMYSSANTHLDNTNKKPTYYFHKTLYLKEKPADNETYVFNYTIDDGMMLYVNGNEIGGYYVNSGSAYSDYTTGGHYEGDSPATGQFTIPNEYLKKGNNYIAVEVKNCSASSSDIYFEGNIERITQEEREDTYLGHDETLCLTDAIEAGSYSIVAEYQEIESQTARYEAGGTPVRINEVSAANDIYVNEYFKKNDWVELYNNTDEEIDVAGMYISDNEKKPQKYQIPESDERNTIIPAHGTLIIWCDELLPISQIHSGFKLSNSDGSIVSILAEDGTWADNMTYLAQPRWTTYGRYPDGGNFCSMLSQPTINKSNRMGTYDFEANAQEWEFTDLSITLELAQGWNWTSHNMANDVDRSRFTSYAQHIKSQTTDLYNDKELGWVGDLKRLSPMNGYKIQMNDAADITLRGKIFDPTTEVNVVSGWNWIGFPLYNATNITAALKNYRPTEGDIIIGHTQTATYENGSWTGTLVSLEPGQAYMLKTSQDQTFCWYSLALSRQKSMRYAPVANDVQSPWDMDIHQYENVMPLIAQLEIDGEEVTDAGLKVGAFWGDECRGVSELCDNLLYMNIHGDGGETLSFRLIDQEGETFQIGQKPIMQSLNLLGTRKAPYLLSVKTGETGVGSIHTASDITSREYYSLSGQRLTHPSGICIVMTTYKDGTVTARKMIN